MGGDGDGECGAVKSCSRHRVGQEVSSLFDFLRRLGAGGKLLKMSLFMYQVFERMKHAMYDPLSNNSSKASEANTYSESEV